jgi:hypothetical protein
VDSNPDRGWTQIERKGGYPAGSKTPREVGPPPPAMSKRRPKAPAR